MCSFVLPKCRMIRNPSIMRKMALNHKLANSLANTAFHVVKSKLFHQNIEQCCIYIDKFVHTSYHCNLDWGIVK